MKITDLRARASHAELLAGIGRARELAEDADRFGAIDPSVSRWSVGLHIEHLLLAERGILRWIGQATDDPSDSSPGGGPSPRGRMVLGAGWIPRGRAPAPEMTVPAGSPAGEITAGLATLHSDCDRLGGRLEEIARSRATREHPILGHYTPGQWLRFLDVHHRHHEKIVRDVLRGC